MSSLTPMIKQYNEIKEEYKDSILLFRLGDFYETFFDDAKELSSILNIVLTNRNGHPMAGIPHHALNNYLKKLLESGRKIAICEQMEEPQNAKGIIKRQVTKVLTPGTVIEDNMLEDNSRFSMLFVKNYDYFIIVIYDFSTGNVYLDKFQFKEQEMIDFIINNNFVQILTDYNQRNLINSIKNITKDLYIEILDNWHFSDNYSEELKENYQIKALEFLGFSNEELKALNAVFKYLETTQFKKIKHFKLPKKIHDIDYMYLDSTTVNNLGLIPEKNNKGKSLFDILNKTKTNMGKRLLSDFINRPLKDKHKIIRRQNILSILIYDRVLNQELKEYLSIIKDIDRIATRISLLNANPYDLLALKESLQIIPLINETINSNEEITEYYSISDNLQDIFLLIDENIKEDASNEIGKGEVIKTGVSKELDEYVSLISDIDTVLKNIETSEKEKTNLTSLKVGRNKIYGFYIEISKSQSNKAPDNYIKKQTLTNCERFTIKDLDIIEQKLISAENKIKVLEKIIYSQFIEKLSYHTERIKNLSDQIAFIDVLRGFAEISINNDYIKPTFTEKDTKIINSRHPVVENFVEQFTNNDFIVKEKENFIILTGPNMSGKSTYLRQIGILSIMAQMGCFVPAEKAEIPIYDRIFTRIGAKDDIITGKSTFLMEMLEVSTILNKATENSLVLLDEVGRGTGTLDGISVAWAISEYIFQTLNSITIFATHYTELTLLSDIYDEVITKKVKVIETEQGVVFLHKIEEGISDKSYGIEVSKLAGFPDEIVDRAKEVLEQLSDKVDLERKMKRIKNIKRKKYEAPKGQLKMF